LLMDFIERHAIRCQSRQHVPSAAVGCFGQGGFGLGLRIRRAVIEVKLYQFIPVCPMPFPIVQRVLSMQLQSVDRLKDCVKIEYARRVTVGNDPAVLIISYWVHALPSRSVSAIRQISGLVGWYTAYKAIARP